VISLVDPYIILEARIIQNIFKGLQDWVPIFATLILVLHIPLAYDRELEKSNQ